MWCEQLTHITGVWKQINVFELNITDHWLNNSLYFIFVTQTSKWGYHNCNVDHMDFVTTIHI